MGALMPPTLEISRARFLQNIAAVQARIAPSTLMLAMKDDAYGHGVDWAVDAAIAAAEPVTSFGGYDVPTALRIRQRAADASVFAWVTSADAEIAAALEARIDLGVGRRSTFAG
ncbi:alanine racemase [Microbacterium sp. NIBRBAC000506063]|uniref:alanine racemase n=1 Tax=Microbacterium sp. NIBRBAC000506063 TaxID=2734618 RepID=UPI0039802E40